MNAVLEAASAALDASIFTHTGQPVDTACRVLISAGASRSLPVGVYPKGNRYRAQLSVNGRMQHLGYAQTPEAAAKIVRAVRKVAPAVRRCKPVAPVTPPVKLEAASCPQ